MARREAAVSMGCLIRQQLPLRVGGQTGQACRTFLKKYGISSPRLARLTIAATNARFQLADFTGRGRGKSSSEGAVPIACILPRLGPRLRSSPCNLGGLALHRH